MKSEVSGRRQVRSRALRSSAILLAVAAAAPAYAQCAPDPVPSNSAVTCAGTDANGLRVTGSNSRITVEAGATVQGSGGPAIDIAVTNNGNYIYSDTQLTVNGSVSGGTQAGVRLTQQNYGTSNLQMTVGAAGSVTGSTGILITDQPSGYYYSLFRLVNGGSITGTGGIAILSTGYGSRIESITNQATGSIGAIVGTIGSFTNAGTIDGGTRSAWDGRAFADPYYYYYYGSSFLTNTGTIQSGSQDATIQHGATLTISNRGTIANRGTGAAITGSQLNVTNLTGGRITSVGGTALRATGQLGLTNLGTIVGDVVVANTGSFPTNSWVSNRFGTITGNLLFGAGDDVLQVAYADGQLRTGVSGTIDGGAGIDLLRASFATSATLNGAVPLPTNFERLGLALDKDVTVTLAGGFSAPGTLSVSGGTTINRTTLSGTGTVVVADTSVNSGDSARFINAGTLRKQGDSAGYAIDWFNGGLFDNRGTISSSAGGILTGSLGLTNSGVITTTGDAVVNYYGGAFDNSGIIRSLTGTGVTFLSRYTDTPATNSGRIEGATAGVRLDGRLTNSGTIIASGTAVMLGYYDTLVNQAGGVITGGTRAIGSGSDWSLSNSTVANAGTINGDVVLSDQYQYYGSNSYYALRGGMLNGNLVLGQGGLLVTELVHDGPGTFGGIAGNVTAPGGRLVYRVRGDVTANRIPGPFASIGYDLYDGAKLVVGGVGGSMPLIVAGSGSVENYIDITATAAPGIQTRALSLAPGETTVATGVAITNRANLTLVRTDPFRNTSVLVTLDNLASFTNSGSILVRNRTGTTDYYSTYAITGGKDVANYGTITLDNAIGVANARSVRNYGSIVQAAGGGASTGATGFDSFYNYGTVQVGGAALTIGSDYGYYNQPVVVENSGSLISTGGAAITSRNYYNTNGIVRNLASGVITGTGGTAVLASDLVIDNAGTINGSVNHRGTFSYGYAGSAYIANGGTLNGDLLFGDRDDVFVETDGRTGVTGVIDGGNGNDLYRYRRTASGTVTLGVRTARGFERDSVEAYTAGTVLTIASDTAVNTLQALGIGSIVNTANVRGRVTLGSLGDSNTVRFDRPGTLAAFTNKAVVGSVSGTVGSFVNDGTIGSTTLSGNAVQLENAGGLSFVNNGSITSSTRGTAVGLSGDGTILATNTGSILRGGFYAYTTGTAGAKTGEPFAVVLNNSGTIQARGASDTYLYTTAQIYVGSNAGSGKVLVNNSGTIANDRQGGTGLWINIGQAYDDSPSSAVAPVKTVTINNSGTIRANAGYSEFQTGYWSVNGFYTLPAEAVAVSGDRSVVASITNSASGVMEATGARSIAVSVSGATLDLTNAGTIRGGAGTILDEDDLLADTLGSRYLAGAIQSSGGNDRIVNTGTIIGSIATGDGDDRIENYGRIEGNVFLGAGNDTFLHRASATQIGTVDAGAGDDSFILDATGGGTVNGDQFINFERFTQMGSGNVTYAGTFRFNTVGVMGGSVTVDAGQTLSSTGAVTISGSDAAETVTNNGTITGSVELNGGDDRFVNAGRVGGSVLLGSGNDTFVDIAGSSVAGMIDGGSGDDLYNVRLAGDRGGLSNVRGFERLLVEGAGTLSLNLTESLDRITLVGSDLVVAQRGLRIGAIVGSDAVERVAVDGDVPLVSLGAGDDRLSLGTATAAGRYDGGAGEDVLTFAGTAPVVLSGQVTGFEAVLLKGGSLTVTGTLGSAGAPIWFGPGDQTLSVANGGLLAGTIDLADGNDTFRLAAGGGLNGTVSGGAGSDTAIVEVAGDRGLAAGTLTGFETLVSEGSGTLTLAGSHSYDRVNAGTNLMIAAGAGLVAPQVTFGSGDQRFTVIGAFNGSVDGGAGTDSILVYGGSSAAPVAFGNVANVESFGMLAGYATVSGTASFGNVALTAGQLLGLAGSTMSAGQFSVARGAVFGSAGTVNGNLLVAGVLSPGASPSTMTVNGNVSLASGSTSIFELSQGLSDKLVVNGAVQIASGSTLQLTRTGTIRPGTSFDLVTATGGITGSFTTIQKPADLFGYVAQTSDRIRLLGQFRQESSFTPQVARSVDYANARLVQVADNSPLLTAVPQLLTADGAADPVRFAQITPEAYASATQIGVDNALTLTQATRSPAFAAGGSERGAHVFVQAVGQWHTLGTDARQGVSKAQNQGHGYLGGLAYGDGMSTISMFAGWMQTRQWIKPLIASTEADGVVVGVAARTTLPGGFGFSTSAVYDGADAYTTRVLPSAPGLARGSYGLTSLSADLTLNYTAEVGTGWAIVPSVGATYVATTRRGVSEAGGNAFALNVARDKHVAGFVDAGLTVGRSARSDAAFRPFVTMGGRYQFEGTRADALGGYAGGALDLLALGAARAPMVATVSGGLAYRYGRSVELYSVVSAQTGRDDHQESILSGVRLRF